MRIYIFRWDGIWCSGAFEWDVCKLPRWWTPLIYSSIFFCASSGSLYWRPPYEWDIKSVWDFESDVPWVWRYFCGESFVFRHMLYRAERVHQFITASKSVDADLQLLSRQSRLSYIDTPCIRNNNKKKYKITQSTASLKTPNFQLFNEQALRLLFLLHLNENCQVMQLSCSFARASYKRPDAKRNTWRNGAFNGASPFAPRLPPHCSRSYIATSSLYVLALSLSFSAAVRRRRL